MLLDANKEKQILTKLQVFLSNLTKISARK